MFIAIELIPYIHINNICNVRELANKQQGEFERKLSVDSTGICLVSINRPITVLQSSRQRGEGGAENVQLRNVTIDRYFPHHDVMTDWLIK